MGGMKRTRHFWIADLFPDSLIARRMFGMDSLYFEGKLRLVLGEAKEPWCGLMVCTDRERQPDLQKDFPELTPHPILPSWLYLSEQSANFEEYAERLVRLILRRDPRIGVEPKPRKRSAKKQKRKIRARANPKRKVSKAAPHRRRGSAASAR
jgi:hypothetical protein